jgi:phosphatidate cytidylyltransferase
VRASADPGPAAAGAARPAAAAPAARWRDLRKRVLSAALLAPAAVLCIWLGAEAWTALMAAAAALLAWEWVRLCGFSTRRLPGVAVPVAVLAAGTLAVGSQWLAAILLLCAGAAAVGGLAARPGAAAAGTRGGTAGRWLAFGVLYIGIACIALIHLRGDAAAGRFNVLFLFLTVWASDIGAYAAGRWLGGPKLAPAVSPNKTWSGAAGGLLSAVAVGAAAAYAMAGAGVPARVLMMAGAIGVLAQAGDLFESWIKRRFDVKDSSALIPGHGGLLDRLDGVLAAAPAAAAIAVLAGRGEALWR